MEAVNQAVGQGASARKRWQPPREAEIGEAEILTGRDDTDEHHRVSNLVTAHCHLAQLQYNSEPVSTKENG